MPVKMRSRGFTLIELVVTMILIGILSAVAIPRLSSANLDDAVYQSQVLTALQFAHRTAISARRYVCVSIAPGSTTSNGLTLYIDPRQPETSSITFCDSNKVALNLPASTTNRVNPRSALSISISSTPQLTPDADGTQSFYFNALGQASNGIVLTVAGKTITIEQETGYAY